MSKEFKKLALQWTCLGGTSLLLLIILLFSNLEALAFSLPHYKEQFRQLQRSAATGMAEEELLRVSYEMISYLKGERKDLFLEAEIDSRLVPLFTERELLHMKDVRDLFQRGYRLRNGAVLLLSLILVVNVFHSKRRPLTVLAYTVNRAALLGLAGLAVVSVLLYLSFDFWFDTFHFLSFNNDLWLLDPSRHNLIRMFPREFFYNTTMCFVRRTLIQLVVLALLSAWYLGKQRGKVQDDLRAGPGRIP